MDEAREDSDIPPLRHQPGKERVRSGMRSGVEEGSVAAHVAKNNHSPA